MKSPEYTKPVMDFIDEHCTCFDGEEVRFEGVRVGGGAAPLAAKGNLRVSRGDVAPDSQETPHELQKLHAQFVEMVFGLLEGFLAEIGVSQEE